MGFLLSWTLGCTCGAILGVTWCPWALGGLFALAWRSPPSLRAAAIGSAIFLAAMAYGSLRAPATPLLGSPEGWMEVQGVVQSSAREDRGKVRLELQEVVLEDAPLTQPLTLRVPGRCAWPRGTRFAARARLRSRGPAGSPRRFFGSSDAGQVASVPCPAVERAFPLIRLPGHEVSGLLRALTLGDRSGLSPRIREHFIDTGTMHLLAISGLHLGVVAWGLYRVLLLLLTMAGPRAAIRDNPRLAAAGALAGIWVAMHLIQTSDATLRAAWAITFVLLGLVGGRAVDSRRALVLAAAGLVTFDPLAPLGASFQLSFAAVIAILAVMPPIQWVASALDEPGRVFSPVLARMGKFVFGAILVNLAATLATAPIALAWFGQFASIGPLINLVATPWVSVVVVPTALLWSLLAGVWSGAAELASPLLSTVLGMLLDGVEVWADLAGSAQAAQWPLGPSLLMSAGFLVALGAPTARLLGLVGIAAGALFVSLHTAPPAHWNLTVLDVGHGDAILLEGPGGETALVDAGGDRRDRERARDRARRSILPALARRGVDHLDLLVLTHGDLDHAGGAHEVIRRIPVGQLWISACAQRRLVRDAARSVIRGGGEVIRVSSGRPIQWGEATLQVLWPSRDAPCSRTENDRSIVLRLATPGGSALLMGDAGAAVEARLLAADPQALESDVLKVGHHGSKSASTPEFLEAVGGKLALVSAPARHARSLPSRDALRRLRRAGLQTWITGRDGGLTVRFRIGSQPALEALRTP